MIKLILTIFLLTFSVEAKTLTNKQIKLLNLCYAYGVEYDLGYTLMGICYTESKGGLFKINPLSGDYGVTQINLHTALARLDLPNTWRNRNLTATRLVENDYLAIDLALKELLYWRDIRGNDWTHTVLRYNQGNTITDLSYVRIVSKNIKYLKSLDILYK